VDHLTVADIDSDMACSCCVVRSLEKDDVARLSLRRWDRIRPLPETFRRCSSDTADAGVIDDPADKTAAVKSRGRAGSSPDIGSPQIFGRLLPHRCKLRIGQGFSARLIMNACRTSGGSSAVRIRIGIDVILKQVFLVAVRLLEEQIPLHLVIREMPVSSNHGIRRAALVQRHPQDVVLVLHLHRHRCTSSRSVDPSSLCHRVVAGLWSPSGFWYLTIRLGRQLKLILSDQRSPCSFRLHLLRGVTPRTGRSAVAASSYGSCPISAERVSGIRHSPGESDSICYRWCF
jgi:hypothetical protein